MEGVVNNTPSIQHFPNSDPLLTGKVDFFERKNYLTPILKSYCMD